MKIYAVFDMLNRQISAGMKYAAAHKAKKTIEEISRCGFIQAIVATPPFRVTKLDI